MIQAKKKRLAWASNADLRIGASVCRLWVALLAPGALFLALEPAEAQLDVNPTGVFYVDQNPSVWTGPGGQYIAFQANITWNNSPATPDEIIPYAVTGAYSLNGVSKSAQFYLNPDYEPVSPNLWYSQYLTNFKSGGTTYSLTNPSSPFTLQIYSNNSPAYTSLGSYNLGTLAGPGQIPAVQNVTVSGNSGNPTFTWSPPPGFTPQGYLLLIYQVAPSGELGAKVVSARQTQPSYTVQASDFTVPGYGLTPNTQYVLEIETLTTRNGSTTDLSGSNTAAEGRVYVGFDTVPVTNGNGSPPVNLPTIVAYNNGVKYDFNMTVAPGETFDIDPAVATGFIYQTGSGNPNFASVELADIGNPNPYELLSWNGTQFVFASFLSANKVYDFGGGGVTEFEVLGIDPRLGLNPKDTTDFVTGLTFEGSGDFTGSMTPITANVPESSTWVTMLIGFAAVGFVSWRSQTVPRQRPGRAPMSLCRGASRELR